MYMSKPYQEDELYKNIDTLLAKGRRHEPLRTAAEWFGALPVFGIKRP
jgi:hypothetical protein